MDSTVDSKIRDWNNKARHGLTSLRGALAEIKNSDFHNKTSLKRLERQLQSAEHHFDCIQQETDKELLNG